MAECAVAERPDLTDLHDDPQLLHERVLVLRAQVGDHAAFHELVTLYQERLMYYVQLRVKKLLAHDPEINDTQLKEFRMQLDQSIESLEQKSKRTRRRILIALAAYLVAMVICVFLMLLWRDGAPTADAGIIRGLVYWPLVIAAWAAVLTGIWLVALYVFKYSPELNRARFNVQTSMLLELQQQVKQLHEKPERQDT